MKLQLKIILIAALFALAAPVRSADDPVDQVTAEQLQPAKQMEAGRVFTPEQVRAAESRLQENPKDLDTPLQFFDHD